MPHTWNTTRRIAFSFTLACLFISPVWLIAFSLGMPLDEKYLNNFYHYRGAFDHIEFFSIILITITLTVLFNGLVRWSATNPWVRVVVVLTCLSGLVFLLDGVRRAFLHELSAGNILAFVQIHGVLTVFIAVVGVGGVAWLRVIALKTLIMLVLFLSPAAVVFMINNVAAIAKLSGGSFGYLSYDRRLTPPQAKAVGQSRPARTVAIIFDDWDHSITFENRDPTVEMPNLDALMPYVIQAFNVQRFGGVTRRAVPTFLTGSHVENSVPERRGDLGLQMANGRTVMFTQAHTLFHAAREAGLNTGYAGIGYHPYCILFSSVISRCWGGGWVPARAVRNVVGQIHYVLKKALPGASRIFGTVSKRMHPDPEVDNFLKLRRMVLDAAVDPEVDFLLIHLLLPHPPYFYDRETDSFTANTWDSERYLDQLELLDRTLGDLRAAMTDAGLWDSTNLFLFSDHPTVFATEYRDPDDNRIPLVIKMAGQRERLEIHEPIEAVRLYGLLDRIFRGEISTPRETTAYLLGK